MHIAPTSIVFGAWGQPGRFFREEGTAQALEAAGVVVNRIVSPPEAGSDPNLLTPILTAAFLKDPDTKLICQAGGQTLSTTPTYMQAINKGPGEVINIGYDLSPAIIDAFAAGWVQLTSDQQPYLQGYLPILSLVLSIVGAGGSGAEESGGKGRRGIPLSPREEEVLRLVAEGLTNKEIARQLKLSENTVKTHVTSLFNRLGVDSRARAVAVAANEGRLDGVTGQANAGD